MKRVDPQVYTTDYYLNDCSGYADFKKSHGTKLEPRLARVVQEIKIKKGDLVLDIGCGRGELIYWAARQGAKAVGIDYAPSAIKLAQEAHRHWSRQVQRRTSFEQMDAKKLKFCDDNFDVVVMTEVWEHLYPDEQLQVLKEAKRVLKPSGKLIIHTAPSRYFNDYAYRFWCYPMSSLLVGLRNLLKPKQKYGNLMPWRQLRTQSHRVMHVAEPDYLSMRQRLSQAGFAGKITSTNVTVLKPELSWKDKLFNALVYLHPLGIKFPFNVLWGNDFLVIVSTN